MSLRIDWTPRAQRDLARLDRPTRERIVAAVLRLAATSQGNIVKLAGKQPPVLEHSGSHRPRPTAHPPRR